MPKESKKRAEETKKARARSEVYKAINAGTVVRKSCIRCGAAKSEAHHLDYERPLLIVWLCMPCHRRMHSSRPDLPAVPRKKSKIVGRLTVTIPRSLVRVSRAAARSNHQSMSALIAQQLREGVERLEAERAK